METIIFILVNLYQYPICIEKQLSTANKRKKKGKERKRKREREVESQKRLYLKLIIEPLISNRYIKVRRKGKRYEITEKRKKNPEKKKE